MLQCFISRQTKEPKFNPSNKWKLQTLYVTVLYQYAEESKFICYNPLSIGKGTKVYSSSNKMKMQSLCVTVFYEYAEKTKNIFLCIHTQKVQALKCLYIYIYTHTHTHTHTYIHTHTHIYTLPIR